MLTCMFSSVGLRCYAIYDFCRLLWWIFADLFGFLLTCSDFVDLPKINSEKRW